MSFQKKLKIAFFSEITTKS